MLPILLTQFRQTLRVPWTFLAMIVMSVVMALVFGVQATSSLNVPVVAEAGMAPAAAADWVERLNASSSFEFQLVADGEEILRRIESNRSGMLLRVGDESWHLYVPPGDESTPALSSWVSSVYREELALRAAASAGTATGDPADGAALDELRAAVNARLQQPALSVTSTQVESAEEFAYDPRTQGMFGMGLFFVTFTLLFGVNMILEERRMGIWDRVIVSPASKASMFGGHFVYTFLTGMVQLLIVFTVFRLGFGVDTGPNWGAALLVAMAYCAAITALGMLLAGLVNNAQQMNVVIPIVAVSMAMIGGAYWPIEIVSNRVLLGLSQALPMRHAMDAFKGLAYHAWGLPEVTVHLGFMAAFALVCAAVGIWLVDRRAS